MPASDMVEAQWVAERRGLERFRTEQPPCSILNRGIEAEVLPVAHRYGMGTLVWSPLAKGMLTGRIRKGQQTDLRRAAILTSFSDEARLDAVEQIIPVAEKAGLRMTHLAMAFARTRRGQRAERPGAGERDDTGAVASLRRRVLRGRTSGASHSCGSRGTRYPLSRVQRQVEGSRGTRYPLSRVQRQVEGPYAALCPLGMLKWNSWAGGSGSLSARSAARC